MSAADLLLRPGDGFLAGPPAPESGLGAGGFERGDAEGFNLAGEDAAGDQAPQQREHLGPPFPGQRVPPVGGQGLIAYRESELVRGATLMARK